MNPPQNRDVLQNLVNQFNRQSPNVRVESLYVEQADQKTPKILASAVGNAPPDLWSGGEPLTNTQTYSKDKNVSLVNESAIASSARELIPCLIAKVLLRRPNITITNVFDLLYIYIKMTGILPVIQTCILDE